MHSLWRQILNKCTAKYKLIQMIHLQQIVWRDNSTKELSVYQLNTVTYGTVSAPYLTIRCLHELEKQNPSQFPNESDCIKYDFYADDLLTGADDITTLKVKCSNEIKILASAGFVLHKWTRNATELNSHKIRLQNQNISINNDHITLGIVY